MQPPEKNMTSVQLPSPFPASSSCFSLRQCWSLPLCSKHLASNPDFSALYFIRVDRPLDIDAGPGHSASYCWVRETWMWLWLWCPSGELIEGPILPCRTVSKVLGPLPTNAFLFVLPKQRAHPLSWILSLPPVQDQFLAPWHLKIKLS